MGKVIDLPEIERDEQREPRPFNMPRQDRSAAATGCAMVILAWACAMSLLLIIALTGGLARLAFWAVGA